jgi:hypothetical protein
MEFLQQGPAETTAYMIAGYSVIFGIMLIYIVSLIVRHRSLKADLAVISDLVPPEEQVVQVTTEP